MSDLTKSLERSLEEAKYIKLQDKISDLEKYVSSNYEITMNSKYSRVIYWDPEDKIYVLEIPELPFCAAHGYTVVGALINSEMCIADYMDTLKEQGKEMPKPIEANDGAKTLIDYVDKVKNIHRELKDIIKEMISKYSLEELVDFIKKLDVKE